MTARAAPWTEDRVPWSRIFPLGCAQIISWGTLYYSFTLLLAPLEAELGWTKTELTAAFSLALVVGGLASLPFGRWIDLHGGRGLMTIGSVWCALLVAALSLVESQVLFYVIWAGLGLAMASTFYEPAFAILLINLRTSARQSITALTLLGGFAGAIFVPFSNLLIDTLGWREALLVLAAINLAVCAPIHLWALKGTTGGDADPGDETRPKSWAPFFRALGLPVFWMLMLAFICHAFAFSALPIHFIPMLGDRGVSKDAAVAVFALIGPSQVAGRVMMATAERWLSPRVTGLLSFVLLVASFVILVLGGGNVIGFAAFAIAYGLANGMITIVRATAAAELIGRDGIGAIQGGMAFVVVMVLAAAPFAAALVERSAGGYSPVIQIWLVLSFIAFAAYGAALRLAKPV